MGAPFNSRYVQYINRIDVSHYVIHCFYRLFHEVNMGNRTLSTTAREAVHNFTHYAALVDAGAEVIITRRGRASLKLVRADAHNPQVDRDELLKLALSFRLNKPFPGKFKRADAYER
jgi:antitoxin (DNA-binding transcriptional repressor) of toxin-antitoxin stability system